MLLFQAALSMIERCLNTLISLDPNTKQAFKQLSGQRLLVLIKDLNRYVILAFDQKIMLIQGEKNADHDCFLSLSLDAIPALIQEQNLTQLIKQDQLDIQGNMHLAQDIAAIIKNINVDWEECLSQHTGDVVANQLFKMFRQAQQTSRTQIEKMTRLVSEGAIEEKKIMAPALGVAHFGDEVSVIRSDTARLERRIAKLEEKK